MSENIKPQLTNTNSIPSSVILLQMMCDWSVDHHGTGWCANLEVELWKLVLAERDNSPGTTAFDYFSNKSGGWWVWDESNNQMPSLAQSDDQGHIGHPVFIPIENWLKLFADIETSRT